MTAKEKGFSLVELMIALVIGMILIAGVLQTFLGSTVTYSMQSGLSKIQENGRFAMSFLSRDLRQAGYAGCSSNTTFANTIRTGASDAVVSFLDITNPIGGQDNVDGSGDAYLGSDVVEVRFADSNGACDIESHNPTAASFQCEANNDFERGEVLIVTDCSHTAVFQFTKTGTDNSVVVHNAGGAVEPGNCTKGLGTPVVCTANGTSYPFNNGTVMRMNAYQYFVGDNTLGEPALHRQRIDVDGAGEYGVVVEELVEGIEDMQVLYGEDTNGDGTANYYVPFDEIADADDVISIRVSLLVRSIENNIVQGTQTLIYNGSNTPFSDGRLRKVFTSTIALRNRL